MTKLANGSLLQTIRTLHPTSWISMVFLSLKLFNILKKRLTRHSGEEMTISRLSSERLTTTTPFVFFFNLRADVFVIGFTLSGTCCQVEARNREPHAKVGFASHLEYMRD